MMEDIKTLFDEKYKVLIVDDVPKNIQVLASILGSKGIKVGFATSGKQALNIVAVQDIDLILLDVAMPEMDGFEVCRRLKEDEKNKNIPVIFLTARVQIEDVIQGFDTGAVDYVTKPFNPAVLLSRVFTHLELKRSRDVMAKYIEIIDQQNSELVDVNYTKDKLFSIISHDLRTPISNIKSIMELMAQDTYLNESTQSYVQLGAKAAGSAFNLVENLLSWSRTQMGNISLQIEEIDVDVLIEENIELNSVSAHNKKIVLLKSGEQKLQANADETTTKTVLRNLISNAIKFTPSGGKITISARSIVTDDEPFVELSISDNGIGINSGQIDKLFKKKEFYTTYGTENEKGAGLGLQICAEFVKNNGGKLWVKSEFGKGSTFFFTVPAPNAV